MSKNKRWETQGISIQRITFLGMFLSFLFIAKYVFGFVAGFETTTFLFMMAALILPTKDSFILVVAFNLLNLIFYGFGSWWIVYWFIWPTDVIVTKLISKFTKNKFALATTGFLLGLSLILWFFIADLIMFDNVFAIANTISALPINLIGGVGTFVLFIILADPLLRVSEFRSMDIWGSGGYRLNEIKNPTLNITASMGVASLGLSSIVVLALNNDFFLKAKDDFIQGVEVEYNNEDLVPYQVYEHYKHTLSEDHIAIAIIDGNQHWVDILPYVEDAKLIDVLNLDANGHETDNQSFTFQTQDHGNLGYSIHGYMVDDIHDSWQMEDKFTAMFTWDKMNGGSGTTIEPATLYQFSYNVYN